MVKFVTPSDTRLEKNLLQGLECYKDTQTKTFYIITELTAKLKSDNVRYRRGSAIAERPRDTSCLSEVSFSSTIPRAKCYIIIYVGLRFTNAYN